jgi:MOSC domain-containing protein YiiM
MARRRIGPNRWYGLRVPATFADEYVWYEANAVAGRDLIALGALLVVLALTLPALAGVRGSAFAFICAAVAVAGSLVMTVRSWRLANRLLRERRTSGSEVPVPGRITQLNLKPKVGRTRGLPKSPAPQLTITTDGVEGDFNRWRTEAARGDPDQAVLLLREEDLADLRAEGWPVQAGDLGENLTVAGLPADSLQAGVQVRVGAVLLVLSKPCEPCTVLYSLPYVGSERGHVFLRTLKGRRGWFARVVQGGSVSVGTPMEVTGRGTSQPAT